MSDNFSVNGWKPQKGFSDKVVDDVKKKLASDEEIVIPFKTGSMQKKDKMNSEEGIEFGHADLMNKFKSIDKDGNGKISTMDELNALTEYVQSAQAKGKTLTAKAKSYVDNLYNSAEIDASKEDSSAKLRAKYPEVNSKNIAEIEQQLETLSADPYNNAKDVEYLTNLRDAYWLKYAQMDDNPKRMMAETNKNDLSNIKVGK